MQQNQAIIAELKMETGNTRKLLERIPIGKNDWKPHGKSMELGRLATHTAELPGWITTVMTTDELDFSKREYKPNVDQSAEELVAALDKHVNEATEALQNSTDEDFNKPWTLRNGEHVIFTMPKKTTLRAMALNHHYHHRAQLGVYLRLLDVPVPGMYGPSADDK